MNNSLPDILTLRNNIEFASISQFFHTFQSAFRPWPVTNHDLVYSRNMEANDYVFETEVINPFFYFPLFFFYIFFFDNGNNLLCNDFFA